MQKFLKKEDMERIHDRSLHLLETVGVQVLQEKALRRLKKAGASVENQTGRVRFPRNMVEEHIRLAPKEFILAGRNPENDLTFPLPETEFYTRTNTGAPHLVAPRTNECRDTIRLSEVEEWIRVADALENVNIICSPYPGDTPLVTSGLHEMKAMFENTEKFTWIQPYSEETLPYIVEMACAVAGGRTELEKRPNTSLIVPMVSPLVFKSMDVEIMRIGGEYGIPVNINSLPTMGGTSPITMAGIVLLSNVENLAGDVITQVFNPGTPVIYVAHKFSIDMASGRVLQQSVEAMIAAAAHAEFVKQQYGIPFLTYGSGSDFFLPDGQSQIERAIEGLLVGIGGADIIAGWGQLESVNAISLTQLVIDNDIIGIIRKIRRGIECDDEHLAWEVIAAVGPAGQFMDQDHTARHCREVFVPRAFNKKGKTQWQAEGKPDLVDRANNILDDILKTHKVPPLPDEVSNQLGEILGRAGEKLR